jgi:uncharacterized protein involved in exopolysaccharide biosynthesis
MDLWQRGVRFVERQRPPPGALAVAGLITALGILLVQVPRYESTSTVSVDLAVLTVGLLLGRSTSRPPVRSLSPLVTAEAQEHRDRLAEALDRAPRRAAMPRSGLRR